MFLFLITVLSLLCGSVTWLMIGEYIWGSGALFATLPLYTGTAAALAGILIAAMEYRARRSKKAKRAPMFALTYNAISGIAATGIWLYCLLA